MQKNHIMSTATIINNIRGLSPAEQYFIIEEIQKSLLEKDNGQVKYPKNSENSNGYMLPEEFRVEAKASLTQILNARGIY